MTDPSAHVGPAAAPRGITRVLAAEGVSNFGAMLSRLAIPWLAALTLQATPLQMAALLVADVVSAALGALWLGAWVDGRGKRQVMLRCDGMRCALLVLLAIAVWLGHASMPLLFAVAAVNGVLSMGFELARSAWMAQHVPAAELPRRNAQLAAVGSLSETAAFAAGGWLFQGLGAVLALALDGLSYAASALCLRGVPDTALRRRTGQRPAGGRAPWRTALADQAAEWASGVQAVRARPVLGALARIETLHSFGMALVATSYMIFVSRDLGLPTGTLGMVFATGGLGALLGATLAPAMGRRVGAGRTMAFGLLALALALAAIPLARDAGWVAVALLALHQVAGDAGQTLHEVHDRTLRQTAAPAHLLARVDASIRGAGQLATLAGALVGGLLGTALGARAVLWLAVATTAMAAALAWRRLPRRTAPADGAVPAHGGTVG